MCPELLLKPGAFFLYQEEDEDLSSSLEWDDIGLNTGSIRWKWDTWCAHRSIKRFNERKKERLARSIPLVMSGAEGGKRERVRSILHCMRTG